MPDAPPGWASLSLDKLGTVERGRSRHRPRNAPFLYDGKHPFIQTGDVKAAGLRVQHYSQTYSDAGLAQSRMWPVGTLCITIAANICETAVLGIPACFPDSIVGFTADPDVADTIYVKYALDHQKQRFSGISQGTTQENLSVEKMLSQRFPVPPLREQQRIGSILSAYDDLIEINRRRVGILEEMARRLFEEWFVHLRFPGHEEIQCIDSSHGRIPQGWGIQNVERLVRRLSVGKKYDQKTVRAVGATPVFDQARNGIIGFHDDEPGVIASKTAPVIVFANHTCNQRLVHTSFSTIQNVLPFVPNSTYPRDIYWLHWATNGMVLLNDYKGHWPELMSKELIVPSDEVCRQFGRFVAPLSVAISDLERASVKLRQLRNLLLAPLVSGKLQIAAASRAVRIAAE